MEMPIRASKSLWTMAFALAFFLAAGAQFWGWPVSTCIVVWLLAYGMTYTHIVLEMIMDQNEQIKGRLSCAELELTRIRACLSLTSAADESQATGVAPE